MPGSAAEFRDPLESILRCLRRLRLPHVLIGGVAVSQLSQPRATADIDLLVMLEGDDRLGDLHQAAESCGFVSRIPDAVQFALRNRVLLLRHQATGIAVDLSLGLLPFEREVIERSTVHPVGGLQLPLPAVEDLIILKAVAHRERDLQDIRMLAAANPGLDAKRVRDVVAEFARALDMPEMLDDLAPLLPSGG